MSADLNDSAAWKALEKIRDYGGIDNGNPSVIKLSASGHLQCRRIAREAVGHRLEEIKRMLVPDLHAFETLGVNLDIEVDSNAGCLLVKGINGILNRELGFVITSRSVNDGTYKAQFSPCVQKLVECLVMDQEKFERESYSERLGM